MHHERSGAPPVGHRRLSGLQPERGKTPAPAVGSRSTHGRNARRHACRTQGEAGGAGASWSAAASTASASFRDLALQGAAACCWSSAATSAGACSAAPSRMIHGGLRYLENGEFGLVRESLRERDALLRNAPHHGPPAAHHRADPACLQRPAQRRLRRARAAQQAGRARRAAVKLGLALYDRLSRDGADDAAPRLPAADGDARALWPDLPPTVRFSATYHDAWISHPERLGIELVARRARTRIREAMALNHVAAARPARATGYRFDGRADRQTDVERRARISSSTPPAPGSTRPTTALGGRIARGAPLVGGTKGSHLILDHPDSRPGAQRPHDLLRERRRAGLHRLPLSRPRAAGLDRHPRRTRRRMSAARTRRSRYILKSLSCVFPGIRARRRDRLRYSGIRPLPRSDAELHRTHLARSFPRRDRGRAPAALPRRRQVDDVPRLRRAGRRRGAGRCSAVRAACRRADVPIGGGAGFPGRPRPAGRRWSPNCRRSSALRTGAPRMSSTTTARDAGQVLAFCAALPDDAPVGREPATPTAELRYLIRSRARARSPPTSLLRRTSLAITGALSARRRSTQAVGRSLADELGWSDDAGRRRGARFRDRARPLSRAHRRHPARARPRTPQGVDECA